MIFSKQELSEIFNQNIKHDISGICVNSKDVKNGDLFIALKGEKLDGHEFVKEALDNGAAMAIVERKINNIHGEKLIAVDSSYDALLKLAGYNLKHVRAKYICVTGSVGKTTTKNMLYHILSQQSSMTYSTMKNFNSRIGLPICAAMMPRDTKIGIFEMGMTEKGHINKLTEIINPSIAVITTIGEAHLGSGSFDSVFDIARAKSEIFENGAEFAIIPSDSPYFDFLKDKALSCGIKNVLSFGFNEKSDAKIISCCYSEKGIKVQAKILEKTTDYEIQTNNKALAINSIASILAAHVASGIEIENLAKLLNSFVATSGRGETVYIKNRSIIVIDDSYNASPASMKAGIRSLYRYTNCRKIAVIGDMKELGSDSVHFHENLSPTIDKYGIDLVFACGNLMKYLYDNLSEHKKGSWREISSELAEDVLSEIKDGDCILVKGSNSMSMNFIVDAIKNKFLDG